MKDFRSLIVWKKVHELTLLVYEITKTFSKEELYGLTSQLRRAVRSVPTNIAEGCGRSSAEFRHFLQIAKGSACEVEYLLLLSHELHMTKDSDYEELSKRIVEVKKMLSSLFAKLKTDR